MNTFHTKKYEQLVSELDSNQQKAACADTNVVIAAGAGSGKTRVLAARYVHLIVEKGFTVDSIIALTFTKKAASEMYSRIYETLRTIDHPNAQTAIENFFQANITTLDSFSNSIARKACKRYGISPDFVIDTDRAKSLASELALPFLLEHRTSPALRQLMKTYSLSELPQRFLANTMLQYAPISSPPDFSVFFEKQKEATRIKVEQRIDQLYSLLADIRVLSAGTGSFWTALKEKTAEIPHRCDPYNSEERKTFCSWCDSFCAIPNRTGSSKNPDVLAAKENFVKFKETYESFLSLLNFILNEEHIKGLFSILSEFMVLYNNKKRQEGICTFIDVARLAVDALIDDSELRFSLKNSISAIMIDEFQDDNELQRDLLFLLAERLDRNEPSVPPACDLCPDKLFFVGDEKQSIYRFRGADVSVFRSLSFELSRNTKAAQEMPKLETNYRTETDLISIFNKFFPYVFLNPALKTAEEFPLYEAVFDGICANRKTPGIDAQLDVLLVNKKNFNSDSTALYGPDETEAAEVSKRIQTLIHERYPVRGKDGVARPCTHDDIAILFRSTSKQHYFEKHLREHSIPYQSESIRGLFSDAPVNDLYALLRLAVYPQDATSFAILLRSPFVNVSDEAFIALMEERKRDPCAFSAFSDSFEQRIQDGAIILSQEDAVRYKNAKELFDTIQSLADRIPAAKLVSTLWYDYGYRYVLLQDPELTRYTELYDYFFELARQADERGESLARFLDHLFEIMHSGQKIEDLDIPVEKTGGVRLMTVHKSKGLEFPIVFIVSCGSQQKQLINSEPVYVSDTYGITINTGAADEDENANRNWVYMEAKEEEQKKERAELRRLLYVAMTRAETRLYISGIYSFGSDEVEKARNQTEIVQELQETLNNKTSQQSRSFFDLLLPALLDPTKNVYIEEILPLLRPKSAIRTQIRSDQMKSNLERFHTTLPQAHYESGVKYKYKATELHQKNLNLLIHPPSSETTTVSDELDTILKKLGIPPTKFGTYVHQCIESKFTKQPVFVPKEIRPIAEKMAASFIDSDLGKKASQASIRELEFGFLTKWTIEEKDCLVSGQMDLLFIEENIVHIVDYKTDKLIEIQAHEDQLAVYRKAAVDLYQKQVHTWLFYLRHNKAIFVEEKTK